jgi:hypothetical protein
MAKLLGLLAVVGLALTPAAVQAQIAFRNDLKSAVYIQGASVVGGMIRRGPAILIPAGKTASDRRLPFGLRQYTIYDANQPNRVLFRDRIRYAGVPLNFVIERTPAGNIQVVPPGSSQKGGMDNQQGP